jgi:hypothetical protein
MFFLSSLSLSVCLLSLFFDALFLLLLLFMELLRALLLCPGFPLCVRACVYFLLLLLFASVEGFLEDSSWFI